MNTQEDRRTRRRARTVRLAVLVGILAVSTVMGYLHAYHPETWRTVSVDALCPFGGIETLWALLAGGTLVKKIAVSSVVLLIATLAVALVMGRAFCGQICPLGTLQELMGRLGRKLFKRRLIMPAALDRPARYLKYAVLAVFTIWTWTAVELVMRPYDPWVAYHHLTSAELLTEFAVGAVVLGIAVLGSLAYDRFFCKYACPMGAFLALISRLSVFKVRRNAEVCTDCGACSKSCPVNIKVETASTVTSAECIGCAECVNACPAPGALAVSTSRGKILSPLRLTIITVAVFLGVIGVATAAGAFEWTMPTLAGEAHEAAKSGQGIDTSSIKGSTTMAEVADATGIPAEELQTTFGLTAEEMNMPLKDVKAERGFTMEDVRGHVEARMAELNP